ncbi:hypothetical protein [Streptomyces sp. NPDC001770]
MTTLFVSLSPPLRHAVRLRFGSTVTLVASPPDPRPAVTVPMLVTVTVPSAARNAVLLAKVTVLELALFQLYVTEIEVNGLCTEARQLVDGADAEKVADPLLTPLSRETQLKCSLMAREVAVGVYVSGGE